MTNLRDFIIDYLIKNNPTYLYPERELIQKTNRKVDNVFCSFYEHVSFIRYAKANKDFILKECWNSVEYNGFLKISIDYLINNSELSDQDIEYICKRARFTKKKTPFSLIDSIDVPERILRQYFDQFYIDEICKHQKISFRFAWLMRHKIKSARLFENFKVSKKFKTRFLRMRERESELSLLK